MVRISLFLRNASVEAAVARACRARLSMSSGCGLHRRSSLALLRPLRQPRTHRTIFLSRHLSLTATTLPTTTRRSPILGAESGINKVKGRDKSTVTAETAGKAAASGAMPQGAAVGEGNKKSRGDAEELWVVGRVMESIEEWIGAKQEKLRIREIGVIERSSDVISTLDGSLEAREDDAFLEWLSSHEYMSPAPADGEPREDDSQGEGEGGAARKERERVTMFLSDVAARLEELAFENEDSLFRDREEPSVTVEEPSPTGQEEGASGSGPDAGAGNEPQGEEITSMPPMTPEEELFQAKLAVHRAMLGRCFSILSTCLRKEQLKVGLNVEEVAALARSAYLAGPHERLGAIFPLFDTHGDGHLDSDGVERAVDATVTSVTSVADRFYGVAARSALDKKAAKAMPKMMKYAQWDMLQVPLKRRCAFAWAENRKQVGPDEWRVSWEQFAPSRREHYPEFESTASTYMSEYSRLRSAWHNQRKSSRSNKIHGAVLFFGVLIVDYWLMIV